MSENVDRLLGNLAKQTHRAYGSVTGRLRRITVDDDEHKSELQIRNSLTGDYVPCQFERAIASEIGAKIGQRLVVYGLIRYSYDYNPQHIVVDQYEILPENKDL